MELTAAGAFAGVGNSEASLASGSDNLTCGSGKAVLSSSGSAEVTGTGGAKFSTSAIMTLEGGTININ